MLQFNSLRLAKLAKLAKQAGKIQHYRPFYPIPCLDTLVRRECVALGAHLDDLGDLCEWIVDSEPEFNNDGSESDSWRNIRPY